MYKLYYSPGACSLATHVVLKELGQPVEAVDRASVDNFLAINPTHAVPVLKDGDQQLSEGVAILLHILEKHENDLLPKNSEARDKVLEAMLFANATMHPAYGRLFFASSAIEDETVRQKFFDKAAEAVNGLWTIVDKQIGSGDFVVGNKLSPADILLTVYSAWGAFFPVDIKLGANVERMIKAVQSRPSYVEAQKAEQAK